MLGRCEGPKSVTCSGKPLGENPLPLLADAPGRRQRRSSRSLCGVFSSPASGRVLSPMPPSATDSALSPLSSSFPELIHGLVVLSAAPRRTGPEWKLRGCYSTRTQYVRYAICRGRRKILQQCWRSPLRPRLGHNTVVSFLRDVASLAPFWTLGLVFSEHRWRRLQAPVRPSVACAIRSLLHPA